MDIFVKKPDKKIFGRKTEGHVREAERSGVVRNCMNSESPNFSRKIK
jgi:hypothetical protein